MALRISTGVRNAMLGKRDSLTASTISFDAASSTISDSGNNLLAKGFRPGDVFDISGSASNNIMTKIVSVDSGGGSMEVEGSLTDEAAGAEITIQTVNGKAIADIFRNHIIHIYSGSPPGSADDPETGTLLCKLTKASGAFTKGSPTNGLNFDLTSIADGLLQDDGEIISGVGLVTGTAGYYRAYDNGEVTGGSTTAKRMQGTVGTSNANLLMTSTGIVADAETKATSHKVSQPATK